MKISVLIENTAQEGYACEHGLSLLIEYGAHKILLDAGTTDLFADNAAKMGVNLADVDIAVLSHGHYDHSGGFEQFFAVNTKASVYARSRVNIRYYSGNGGLHDIGVPRTVLAQTDRFIFSDADCAIADGIRLVGHGSADAAKIGERAKLYKACGTQIVPDDFLHEQSLILDTKNGLVVFNSCSHTGAAAAIAAARRYCRNKPVHAYVGGLHMKGTAQDGRVYCTFSSQELNVLCAVLKRENVQYIYTGHCTGECGIAQLQSRLGSRVIPLHSGMVFEIE